MSITIDFTPVEEARIREAAKNAGSDPSDYVRQLVESNLSEPAAQAKQDPMLALLDQWDREDSCMTHEEILMEDEEWLEFQASINAERDRAGARRVY